MDCTIGSLLGRWRFADGRIAEVEGEAPNGKVLFCWQSPWVTRSRVMSLEEFVAHIEAPGAKYLGRARGRWR